VSNTRHAAPGAPLKQQRYASSPELETGLLANLVAKRCRTIESQADRELVWFLQLLSHRQGGLAAVARELRERFADRMGTKAMRRIGIKPGQVCKAEQVRAIRADLPAFGGDDFLLKGEKDWFLADERERSYSHPNSYPSERFLDLCHRTADDLEDRLIRLCLDPAVSVRGGVWYFHELADCLREYQAARIVELRAATVVTQIGQQIYETLDYAAQSHCLVLIDGLARTGKTFAAKAWCEQRPGSARYVQVPSTNDEVGFFRAIAKALGVSSGLSWKAVQLRERIEEVLQSGDLTLVLDEAHYCWPTTDYRYALPGRITWLMTALLNHRVSVALVTTPQFIRTQKVVERRTNWTSEQLVGRIGHYQKLPDSVPESDLEKVAQAFVPEADDRSIEALVAYAQGSAKYLAGIESVARRARYLAGKEQRERVAFKDIRLAIREGVIPSDAALAEALQDEKQPARRRGRGTLETPLQPLRNGDARTGSEDLSDGQFEGPNRLSRSAPAVPA